MRTLITLLLALMIGVFSACSFDPPAAPGTPEEDDVRVVTETGRSDVGTGSDGGTDSAEGQDTDTGESPSDGGDTCGSSLSLCGETCVDLSSNTDHCGTCNEACEPKPGSEASCEMGSCTWLCESGRIDLNDDLSDGCEYECSPSNDGVETCDGLDNDCDGEVDEQLTQTCQLSSGVCSSTTVACTGGEFPECTASDYGSDYEADETLCDGRDNDCDGEVDEGCECISGDTQNCYSGPSDTIGEGPCVQGTQTCTSGEWGSCDGAIEPIVEVCNDLDDDCDGEIDENASDAPTWYEDQDGDGLGSVSDNVTACDQPSGYVDNSADACPTQAEDVDGFEDSDGCPDTDNDGDGFADTGDQCPTNAEDFDGFEDGDGCPEPEECSTSNINGTCSDYGFDGGYLTCSGGQHDTSNCKDFICGDGVVDPNETCDDGSDNGSYGYCNTSCDGLAAHCGDGIGQHSEEECDDGNTSNGDGCSSSCTLESGTDPQGHSYEYVCLSGQVCNNPCKEHQGDFPLFDVSGYNVNLLKLYCSIDGDLTASAPNTATYRDGFEWSSGGLSDQTQPLSRVTGDVRVDARTVRSFNGLENLMTVGGDLEVYDSDVTNPNDPIISTPSHHFDLSPLRAVQSIGGDLRIEPARRQAVIFEHSISGSDGLSNVQSVGGVVSLRWFRAEVARGFPQFDALTTVGANFVINHVSGYEDIGGFNNLSSVGGYFNLTHLYFDMKTCSDVPEFWGTQTISGFQTLQSIGGELHIKNNKFLWDVDPAFPSNFTVGVSGGLSVVEMYNNGMNGTLSAFDTSCTCGAGQDCRLPYAAGQDMCRICEKTGLTPDNDSVCGLGTGGNCIIGR